MNGHNVSHEFMRYMPMAILDIIVVEIIHIDSSFCRILKAKMVLSYKLARVASRRIRS